jgi:hypothetical protein
MRFDSEGFGIEHNRIRTESIIAGSGFGSVRFGPEIRERIIFSCQTVKRLKVLSPCQKYCKIVDQRVPTQK